jgi:DUF4097 and DUF4098 domain-containing protein YvlB
MFTSLVLMVTTAIALTGCSVKVDVGDTERRVETETVPTDGIAALELVTDNGALDIRGGDVDDIEIETTYQEHERGDGTSSVRVEGDRLRVEGECDSSWFEQCSVSYRIVVPVDLAVSLETDNGRVDLSGLAGRVDVYTDNGAIEARLLATDVHAESDNGRVALTFAEVPRAVEARSDNGSVEITVPASEFAYAVDAESDNGDVDVSVTTDPSAERTIDASSDNGAVTIRQA